MTLQPRARTPVTAREPDAVHDGMEIARLYGEMWRRFQPRRQAISGSAVTPRMLSYLRHLAAAGPLTVGEQADHLGISRATATEVVNRLEAKGLVERMRDERDGRRVFVWLTDRGREQIDALAGRSLDDPFLRAVAALPKATRAAVIEGLGAILRAAVQGDHDQPESDHDQHEEEVS
ncbi:MAG: crosslink repair DNA glycosylase YcaQ family protein [Candidatus Dormibacteria bacterium]|jgi:DNA-binding MarR family transcriptional regulator